MEWKYESEKAGAKLKMPNLMKNVDKSLSILFQLIVLTKISSPVLNHQSIETPFQGKDTRTELSAPNAQD